MHLTRVELGLLEWAFAWVQGLTAPFAGNIVDRVRRRRAILVGLYASNTTAVLTLLARAFPRLFFALTSAIHLQGKISYSKFIPSCRVLQSVLAAATIQPRPRFLELTQFGGLLPAATGNQGPSNHDAPAKGKSLCFPGGGSSSVHFSPFLLGFPCETGAKHKGIFGLGRGCWKIPRPEFATLDIPPQAAVNVADIFRAGRLVPGYESQFHRHA